MGIISKLRNQVSNFFRSIRFSYLVVYLIVMIIILALLNIYPVFISRDLIFSSKETSLLNQVSLISSSLSSLENFSSTTVSQAMRFVETGELAYVAVTDYNGKIIYKDSGNYDFYDEYTNARAIRYALEYNDIFISNFKDGAFFNYAAMPIIASDKLSGTVLIFEFDKQNGDMIINLQKNLIRISFAIFLTALLLGILAINIITNKINLYLSAIKSISERNYNNKLEPGHAYEFVRIADEINLLDKKIRQNEEVNRRFVSDASHELKTPLASIKLLSDSIIQSENIDIETIREFVKDISDEAERLSRITGKLLLLTKIDNKVVIPRTKIRVSNIIERVIKILIPMATANNIKIVPDLDEKCTIMITEDDLYQIVLNLIENAIKYNVSGGYIYVTCKKTGDIVSITISDTGIGIPESAIPHLFDRFYRVDKARTRAAGGSGLGLSIVKSTVEEHDGTIRVESEVGKGTQFIVEFKSVDDDI